MGFFKPQKREYVKNHDAAIGSDVISDQVNLSVSNKNSRSRLAHFKGSPYKDINDIRKEASML